MALHTLFTESNRGYPYKEHTYISMSFKLGSSYRRLIDAETTSCVYLDLSSQKLVLVYIEDLEGEVRDSR